MDGYKGVVEGCGKDGRGVWRGMVMGGRGGEIPSPRDCASEISAACTSVFWSPDGSCFSYSNPHAAHTRVRARIGMQTLSPPKLACGVRL